MQARKADPEKIKMLDRGGTIKSIFQPSYVAMGKGMERRGEQTAHVVTGEQDVRSGKQMYGSPSKQ